MIEPCNCKTWYWGCKKYSEHVFKTKRGVFPSKCPICDNLITSIPKDWYNVMINNQRLAFGEYKQRTKDTACGCYGRFIWSYVFGGGKNIATSN